MMADLRLSWLDRFLITVAPGWGLRRVRARATATMLARHFEAAQGGRRTSGWSRSSSDANVANAPALAALRELSRDLRRNNGWARRGIQVIVNNTVGWGIMPKPNDRSRTRAQKAIALWNDWANSTACDYDGLLNFYGLEQLVMSTVAESGEALVVRQPASSADGLPVPIRLQVLEPDYLDSSRNGMIGPSGGAVIQGVEFDKQGRRVAYYLFTQHPGGMKTMTSRLLSVRTPADRVLHIYQVDRPGQVRGVPWLASAITRLKDFDDFEDAELMQAKVAACFGAFVTEMDGGNPSIATTTTDTDGVQIDQLEPGHVAYLRPGQDIRFAQPPRVQDGSFSTRALRRIAVSLGITYEDLSGDFSQVNYSSARMARLAHWQNVRAWRWQMLIPQFCQGIWRWVMELAVSMNGWPAAPRAKWAAPPMAILEPDKEGLAYQRLIRNGLTTWRQAVSELGEDPTEQLDEIQRTNEELDKRGIVLDCDARRTNAAGQMQQLMGSAEVEDDSEPEDAAGGEDDGAPPSGDGGDAEDSKDEGDPEEEEDAETGAAGGAGAVDG